jgi:hypothetical protein
MTAPFKPSARPGLLVDSRAFGIVDPQGNFIGEVGPFGRERVVSAMPMDPLGVQFPAQAVVDNRGFYLADPDGNLIGEPALYVARMLTAGVTQDTRRLG